MSDENRKPFKFGDIFSLGGAIYGVRAESAEDDLAFGHAEFLKAHFIKDGIPLTPIAVREIEKRAREKAKEIIEGFRSKGVPDIFKRLFEIKKKKDAVRLCKSITIQGPDFALLASNGDQIGFKHSRYHYQIVPEELKPTDAEREAFLNNGVGPFVGAAQKFAKKLFATFKQRKNINAHLFERDNEWHIFWFTYDDMHAAAKGEEPHWEYGDHVHYTSYLWGHKKDETWAKFKEGTYSITGEHIKYVDPRDKE